MSLKIFTRLFYTYQLFRDFILIYAVDKLFLIYRGIELYQIAILIAFWSLSTILLEIPTGALADKWSRKNMLVLSAIFRSLCYVTWFFGSNFWLFLLGFAFRTVSGTFESGTLEAYVFDFLRQKRKEEEFEKIWGRGQASLTIGIAIALSLGGFLSTYSYELVVALSALSPLFTMATSLLFPQVYPVTLIGEKSYLSILKDGIKKAFSNTLLVRVFLYSAIVYAALGMLDEYDQVMLSSWFNMPNSFIGIWLATAMGISSLSGLYAHKLKNMGWKLLNTMAVVTGILLIMISLSNSPLLLGTFLLFWTFSVLINVLTQGVIQREIPSEERATITSVNSLITETGAVILGLIFGFIANRYGIQIGYGFYGLIIITYLSVKFTIERLR
jgi:MFS family permease